MAEKPQPLWDIPTRLFHWLIVGCFALSWWSAEYDYFAWHERSGSAVIVLVVFRIIWGFVGSHHSRFRDFLVGPTKVRAYLRGASADSAGHNPLGGWSVMLLLSLLLIQAVSGLFNTDDVMFSGPLHFSANGEFRDTMGVVHQLAFNGLLGLVGLHVTAVFYHQFKRKEKLLQAMLRGSATGREGREATVPWWPAVLIVAVLGVALWWGLGQAPQPEFFTW
ncbi:MAG: cytochrome b [Halioglobus sp.]|jgi:cytochrome b